MTTQRPIPAPVGLLAALTHRCPPLGCPYSFNPLIICRNALALPALLLVAIPAVAMAKDTKFWNLTNNTIISFEFSPVGKGEWGKNQTDNDPDHGVDHDERLKITGVKSGVYDLKFTDKTGRTCTVKNIPVKEGGVFSLDEKSLPDCTK